MEHVAHLPNNVPNNASIWCPSFPFQQIKIIVDRRRDGLEDRNNKACSLWWFNALSWKNRSLLCVWNDLICSVFSSLSIWSRGKPAPLHTILFNKFCFTDTKVWWQISFKRSLQVSRAQECVRLWDFRKRKEKMFSSALLFYSANTSRTN